MQVKHHTTGDDGIFYIDEGGKRLADMRYMIVNDNRMDIYHTEVALPLEGTGLGTQLIEAGVSYAREKQYKIIPSCTFAKAYFAHNEAQRDILA